MGILWNASDALPMRVGCATDVKRIDSLGREFDDKKNIKNIFYISLAQFKKKQ